MKKTVLLLCLPIMTAWSNEDVMYRRKHRFLTGCCGGNAAIINECLDAGQDIHAEWESQEIPSLIGRNGLDLAVFYRNRAAVALLLSRGADPNRPRPSNRTPFLCACADELEEICELLINHNADLNALGPKNITALQYACSQGNKNLVRLLLEKNADPYLESDDGGTPLSITCKSSQKEIVDILLSSGVDPNIPFGSNRQTPLMMASLLGHKEVVGLLLENKADPNIRARDNVTALMYAMNEGHNQVVRLLLKKGAQDSSLTIPLATTQSASSSSSPPDIDSSPKVTFPDAARHTAELNQNAKGLDYLSRLCAVCEKHAPDRCGGCKEVFYCSLDCLKKDRPTHKNNCKTKAKCTACGKETTSKCGGCQKVFYCSKECLKKDRPSHKNDCKASTKKDVSKKNTDEQK